MKPDELRIVAEFASLAPSVHNTQPWHFVADSGALEVRAELERQLGDPDSSGRQLHISCGIVVEYARLAMRALGYDCAVELLPDPRDATLVARIRAIGRSEATADERRLVEAAARRYTDRGPYSDEALTAAEVERLRAVAESAGCWLRPLTRREDRIAAITLLWDAERAEASDPQYHAELASWQREGTSPDGVPREAYQSWHDEGRVTDVPLRDFTGHDRHPQPRDGVPPTVERDTLVLIGTAQDSPLCWLEARPGDRAGAADPDRREPGEPAARPGAGRAGHAGAAPPRARVTGPAAADAADRSWRRTAAHRPPIRRGAVCGR